MSVIAVQVSGGTPVSKVKIYDTSGKLLLMKAGSISSKYNFNVGALFGGYYTIVVETTNGIISKGFMKQ